MGQAPIWVCSSIACNCSSMRLSLCRMQNEDLSSVKPVILTLADEWEDTEPLSDICSGDEHRDPISRKACRYWAAETHECKVIENYLDETSLKEVLLNLMHCPSELGLYTNHTAEIVPSAGHSQ